MDAVSIETAKLLGTGSAQIILGLMVVALGGVAVWLGRTLYAETKACSAQLLDLTTKKIESDNKLSDAIEANVRVSEAMLAQLRKP